MQRTPTARSVLKLAAASLSLGALVLGVAACSTDEASDDGARTIAVTTNILGDVVTEIVADEAEVLVLMPSGADPHSFQLATSDAARLHGADLIIENGLGLEESIGAHVRSAVSDGIPLLTVGEHVDPLPSSAHSHGDETHDEEHHDHDHDHGHLDPHFWHDPDRMILAVDAIEDALHEIPGIDAHTISENADRYRNELASLSLEMEEALSVVPEEERQFASQHRVFDYFIDRFQFTAVGSVVPSNSTLAAATPEDIATLAQTVRTSGVRVIFTDTSQSDKLVQVIVDESGGDVVIVPLHTESLTPTGGGAETYLDLMQTNTESIVEALNRP